MQLQSFSSSNHQVYVGLLSIFLLLWLHPALGEGRGVARGDDGEMELGSEQVVGRKLEVGEVEGMVLRGELDLEIEEQWTEKGLRRGGRELKLSEEEQEVGSEKGEEVAIMGEKQCLRRVVMEERRVPRQVFSEVIVILLFSLTREVIKCTHSTHRSCHTSYITGNQCTRVNKAKRSQLLLHCIICIKSIL